MGLIVLFTVVRLSSGLTIRPANALRHDAHRVDQQISKGFDRMQFVSARMWCLILLMLTMGCTKPGSSTPAATEEGANATADGEGQGKKSLIPVKRNVKTIDGNWVVVMTNQRLDSYIWIIKLAKGADGKYTTEFLDTSRDKDESIKPEVVSTEVNGDSVHIHLKNASGPFDFVGTFQQGIIRGTLQANPKEVFLTRLLPTDETSLERFNPSGLPPAADIFETLIKGKDTKPDDILNAVKENRTSPLSQDMFAMLMSGHIQANFDEAKVKELIEAYLSAASQWGDRWEARIHMNIAANLINGRKFAHLALAHLDSAEKKVGADKASITDVAGPYRDAANTILRIQDLESKTTTAEQKATAYAELTELLKKQRYHPEILFALATEAEKKGQEDVAIEYFADLVALPMLEAAVLRARSGQPPEGPTPSESLKKLWSKKTGKDSEEDYAKYVDDVYKDRINEYVTQIQKQNSEIPAANAGNRIVLIELLTGMQCPPCVSADLALTAISKTYPISQVIVIRHHQHVPLPDGLVNQDSEERGAFYETGATPTVAIDGLVLDPRFYAGPIQMATAAYGVFRRVIDSRASEKSNVTLELSATVTDGQLHASVAANGIPDELLPSCRLRMAIVENEVRTIVPNGSNGIRDHEFLVREMLGGAKGIPPKKGELKYSITMPISDIQEHAVDYIKRYETGRNFQFPEAMKPPIRGPLSLVAWVQNDKVNEGAIKARVIMQSAIVPITGFGGTTEAAATKPAAAAPTTEETTTETKQTAPAAAAAATAASEPDGEATPPAPALPE